MIRRDVICKVDDCTKVNNYGGGYGYCGKHYRRLKAHGDPLAYSYRDPNTYRVFEDYIEIDLRDMKGNVRAICKIDKTREVLLKHKWFLSTQGYPTTNIDNTPIAMHRLVKRDRPGYTADHINRDKTDNRQSNLRYATPSQNVANRRYRSSSGRKGVSWVKKEQRWKAEITHNYKKITIGRFKDLDEAAQAYAKKAVELFGEFAELGVKNGS